MTSIQIAKKCRDCLYILLETSSTWLAQLPTRLIKKPAKFP